MRTFLSAWVAAGCTVAAAWSADEVLGSRYVAASGLLPARACPAWRSSGSGTASLEGKVLGISTARDSENIRFSQDFAGLSAPDTLIIRFRMRLISGTSGNTARAPACVEFLVGPRVGNALFIGRDELFLLDEHLRRGPRAYVPTMDAFHTYLIRAFGEEVIVYRDSEPLLYGTSVFVPGSERSACIAWGEWSQSARGTSEWESFEHNAAACPAPEADPAQTALQPPGTAAVAAETRSQEPQPVATFRDEFRGSLQPGWAWIRENPQKWHFSSDHLGIEIEPGDLWRTDTNNGRNILVRQVACQDFTLQARLDAYLAADICQARIMLYNDDDDYLLFGVVREREGQLDIDHIQEVGGRVLDQTPTPFRSGPLFLRIVKVGRQVSLLYSFDGAAWRVHREILDLRFQPARVGLAAFAGTEAPSASFAFFDYFEIQESRPEAPRSGESRRAHPANGW